MRLSISVSRANIKPGSSPRKSPVNPPDLPRNCPVPGDTLSTAETLETHDLLTISWYQFTIRLSGRSEIRGFGLTVSPSLGAVRVLSFAHMLAYYSARFALRPSDAECLSMVEELIGVYGWRGACARLGVPGPTVSHWRQGLRLSKGPARRLIWLTWALCLHPERVKTDFDLVTWGRFRK